MINLLPPAAIEKNFVEYRRRRLIALGLLGLGVITAALVLVVSLAVAFWFNRSAAGRTLTLARTQVKREEFARLNSAFEGLNQQLQSLDEERQEQKTPPLTMLVRRLVGHKSNSVHLGDITYERSAAGEVTVKLTGLASSRQSLLDFVASLRRDPIFKSVDSPITNLIKGRDVNFSLSLQLVK